MMLYQKVSGFGESAGLVSLQRADGVKKSICYLECLVLFAAYLGEWDLMLRRSPLQ